MTATTLPNMSANAAEAAAPEVVRPAAATATTTPSATEEMATATGAVEKGEESTTPVAEQDTKENVNNQDNTTESRPSVRRSPDQTHVQNHGHAHPAILLLIETPNGKSVKIETGITDSLLDIRQFLLDCPETCEYTNYALIHSPTQTVLSDYLEIAEYPFLAVPGTHALKLVPDLYDERTAKLHVKRVRDIIANPPHQTSISFVVSVDEIAEREKRRKDNKETADILTTDPLQQPFKLANYPSKTTSSFSASKPSLFPTASSPSKSTDKENKDNSFISLTYSFFNPPPPSRHLRGDLFYLTCVTGEKVTLSITAHIEGFFLNNSTLTTFDPTPSSSPYKSHSLLELLRKISPSFQSHFQKSIQKKVFAHPFDTMEVALPPTNWISSSDSYPPDINRSEDFLYNSYALHRDWNEELQSCHELPSNTPHDRLLRDRTKFRIYLDFIATAKQTALQILSGNIPPVNPLDPPRQHVYIHHNIFFSYAIDSRANYTDCGGDAVSHKFAAHDLHGINEVALLKFSDIHTLATALIDYQGYRLIAQSIIPGIFHGDRASKHVYGSMDNGEHIEYESEFHEKLLPIAQQLHWKEHPVHDSEKKEVSLYSSLESKGIIGSDGRSYLLDVYRYAPIDVTHADSKSSITHLFRPELIKSYCRHLAAQKFFPKRVEGADAKEPENHDQNPLVHPELYSEFLKTITFNVDLHTRNKFNSDDSTNTEVDSSLKSLSDYLTGTAIPNFMQGVNQLEAAPVDSASLKKLLHSHGINLRYLGRINRDSRKLNLHFLDTLTLIEMLARSARAIFHSLLRDMSFDVAKKIEQYYYGAIIVRFLNALVGKHSAGYQLNEDQLSRATYIPPFTALQFMDDGTAVAVAQPVVSGTDKKHSKRKNKGKDMVQSVDLCNASNIWTSIRKLAKEKFDYDLAFTTSEWSEGQKLMLLRTFCNHAGITIAARQIDFNAHQPFTLDDLINYEPKLKYHCPTSFDAHYFVELGKAYLQQQHISTAFSTLVQALSLHTQLYGIMHEQTAEVYSLLASAAYMKSDYAQAMDFEQRALLIYEKVNGVDHYTTAHSHMNLSLYLHSVSQIEAALLHVQRAYRLFETMGGKNHPVTASALLNMTIIYQECAQFQIALRLAQSALERNIAALGENHVQIAVVYHSVAVAFAFLNQYRQAIENEKKCKQLFISLLNPKHPRVAQSQQWLEHFTKLAVALETNLNKKAPTLEALSLFSSIAPPSLGLSSPFTWVNLQIVPSYHAHWRVSDTLYLLEVQDQAPDNAEDETAVTEFDTTGLNGSSGIRQVVDTDIPSTASSATTDNEVNGTSSQSTGAKDKRKKKNSKNKKK